MTALNFVKKAVFVGAIVASSQAFAHHGLFHHNHHQHHGFSKQSCDYNACNQGCTSGCNHGYAIHRHSHLYNHPYPEMWQHHSEVRWGNVHNFHKPMLGGYRLDFCYKNGEYCGRAAANQFCRMNGFRYATQFEAEHNVSVTKEIATGRVNGGVCHDAFRVIRCRS